MDTNVGVHKFPYIPEEIVRRILANLPTMSRARFRSVCEQWSRWISQVVKGPKKLMVLSSSRNKFYFGTIDQKAANLEVIDAPLPRAKPGIETVELLGSCNGLLLVGINDVDLYLWNPTIRHYSHICTRGPHNDCNILAISGLCFDSNSNQYKVVLAWKNIYPHRPVREVEVASLKNRSWTCIPGFPYDLDEFSFDQPGTWINNRLHWVVSSPPDERLTFSAYIIVYFDPKTNKFEKIPMPEGNSDIRGLGVIDECLCMVRSGGYNPSEGAVEVLRMKEYGVKESWTLCFRIEEIGLPRELVPCFYGEGTREIVMNDYGSSSISVYKTDEASFTNDILLPAGMKSRQAIAYEETFVMPP